MFRQWYGKTVISKRPRKTISPPSEEQLGIRSNFKSAVHYAKKAVLNVATKLAYKALAKPGQTAYNMAVADFFHTPMLGEINTSNYSNQAGSFIKMPVTDDFQVTAATVKIENGSLLEEGETTLSEDQETWVYNATVSNGSITGNSITVTATDLTGHSIAKQKTV